MDKIHDSAALWSMVFCKSNSSKLVSTPLATSFKLPMAFSSQVEEKVKQMSLVHYPSDIGSLLYVIVSTRLDIVHVMTIIYRYMGNP